MLSFLLNLIHGVYTQSTLSFVKTNFVVNHRLLCAVFAFEINVNLFASSGIFPFRACTCHSPERTWSLNNFADDNAGWEAGLPLLPAGAAGTFVDTAFSAEPFQTMLIQAAAQISTVSSLG